MNSTSTSSRRRPASQSIVYQYVISCFLCFAALFSYGWLFGRDGQPSETLIISLSGGLFALLVSGTWLPRNIGGILFMGGLVLAYFARTSVGYIAYTEIDPGYFGGSGYYQWGHSEMALSYTSAVMVRDFLLGHDGGIAFWSTILNAGDSKNPIIHWWMGIFLAAFDTDHALDLMAFNAIHHCLAGSGITALAIHFGYSRSAAMSSGMLTAWIPWSFPASLLWRDSVGLFFLVLAISFIAISSVRRPSSYVGLAAAMVLSFAHRTVYPGVILAVLFFNSAATGSAASENRQLHRKVLLLTFGTALGLSLLFAAPQYAFMYRADFDADALLGRLATFPLGIISSIFGPFPWIQVMPPYLAWERAGDAAYHVLQLGAFLCVFAKTRNFYRSLDPMKVMFLLTYGVAVIAPGVHTSYLAMSLPFLLPYTLTRPSLFLTSCLLSLSLFISANALYLMLGL